MVVADVVVADVVVADVVVAVVVTVYDYRSWHSVFD